MFLGYYTKELLPISATGLTTYLVKIILGNINNNKKKIGLDNNGYIKK